MPGFGTPTNGAEYAKGPQGGGGASGGFGSDTIVQLPNSVAALVTALELITEWRVNTAGSEESRLRVFLRETGVAAEAGGFEFSLGSFPMMYIGPQANATGFRTPPNGSNMDVLVAGGAAPISFAATAVNVHQNLICEARVNESASGIIAIATTITWGINNAQPVSVGTGTLNSINMAANGWTAGARVVMPCPAGVTITHNVAGTGATILTNTGANLPATTGKRAIPFYYDGTNMIVEG